MLPILHTGPKNFSKDGNEQQLRNLCNRYAKDVDIQSVLVEYPTLISTIRGIYDCDKSNDVLSFIIEEGMENLSPNMCTMYQIFLTIPVASAHAERSFSRLKLIKNYLRSTMRPERLSNLSRLSIARKISGNCDYDAVIDKFAPMKIRRKKL